MVIRNLNTKGSYIPSVGFVLYKSGSGVGMETVEGLAVGYRDVE